MNNFFILAEPLRDAPPQLLDKFNVLPISLATPGYAYLTNSPSLKYNIYSYRNDELLVIFKKVSIYDTQYIRLIGFPKSLNNNRTTELALFKLLSSDEDVQEVQAFEEDFLKYGLSTLPQDQWISDFIVEPKSVLPSLTGKYRRKNKINEYEKDLVYRDIEPKDFNEVLLLMDAWIKYKQDTEHSIVGKSIFNNIRKHPQRFLIDEYITKVLLYQDKIFGFSLYSKTQNSLYQYVNILDTFSNAFPHNLSKKANRIMYYYLINDFKGYDYINFAGASSNKSTLFQGKLELYKTFKKIYRIKFKK